MKQSCYRRVCGHAIQYTKAERRALVPRHTPACVMPKAPRSRSSSHSAAGHKFRGFLGKGGRGK